MRPSSSQRAASSNLRRSISLSEREQMTTFPPFAAKARRSSSVGCPAKITRPSRALSAKGSSGICGVIVAFVILNLGVSLGVS